MTETEQKPIELWEFLADTPPEKEVYIQKLMDSSDHMITPSVPLYCDQNTCVSTMYFDCTDKSGYTSKKGWRPINLLYVCRHCKHSVKRFALLVYQINGVSGKVMKFGEVPPFGPHTPSRVISLIGPDKQLFFKGRQSENRGLGIGAFTYYRRVVDNNWERLLDESIKVAKKLNLSSDILIKAKETREFGKAVEIMKDGIPQVLLVDGHNPMKILYKILSKGIHDMNDEKCLELAKYIRVILVDFTDRVREALKDRKELQDSLTKLFQADKPQEQTDITDSQDDEQNK